MRFTAIFFVLCAVASAQAPAALGDVYYRERSGHLDEQLAVLARLRGDGTYITIAVRHHTGRISYAVSGWLFLDQPESGTYSYERTDAEHARVVFQSSSPGARFGDGQSRELTFSADDHGKMTIAPLTVFGSFALAELMDPGPLLNASVRGTASRTKPLILGFVVRQRFSPGRFVLIRGLGPTLAQFAVSDFASDPSIRLYRADRSLWQNDTWGNDGGISAERTVNDSGTVAGAPPLPVSSLDAAGAVYLENGAYTVHVHTQEDTPREVLAEVYLLP